MKHYSKNYKLDAFILLVVCVSVLSGAVLSRIAQGMKAYAGKLPSVSFLRVEVPVEVVRTPNCDTEKCKIMSYIIEKFGNDADKAIAMIKTCENGTFDPKRVSPLNIQKNGRRSYDVGIFQMNVDEKNTAEIERMKDWKYNIDQAYKKYAAKNNTFYYWTCGSKVGDRTYLDGGK